VSRENAKNSYLNKEEKKRTFVMIFTSFAIVAFVVPDSWFFFEKDR
jgi:hypothetical protein